MLTSFPQPRALLRRLRDESNACARRRRLRRQVRERRCGLPAKFVHRVCLFAGKGTGHVQEAAGERRVDSRFPRKVVMLSTRV